MGCSLRQRFFVFFDQQEREIETILLDIFRGLDTSAKRRTRQLPFAYSLALLSITYTTDDPVDKVFIMNRESES